MGRLRKKPTLDVDVSLVSNMLHSVARVTMECQVESDLPPEVTWFKDNMPLNSPDYETRFDFGRATLTIEETFSEDTARYTCRFTNQAGVADSSSYLHVRGK